MDTAKEMRTIAFRVPDSLEKQLQTIAARDSNSISATARRLLMVGLRAETAAANGDGR